MALRRTRRVDPAVDPARRAAPAGARRDPGLLARAPCRAASPWRRAGRSTRPVWHGGHRIRPGHARAAGTRAAPAGGGLDVAAARGSPRGRPGRRRRGGHRRAVPAAGSGARRRPAVVGLPRLELVRRRQGRDLRLVARVRPARLAPRRNHPPQRAGRPASLLEGAGARHLRRPALASGGLRKPRQRGRRAGLQAPPCRGRHLGLQRVQPGLERADRLHRPLSVHRTGGGGRDHLRGGGHRRLLTTRRRHHVHGARGGAAKGRQLHRAGLRTRPDEGADAGRARRLLAQRDRLHRAVPPRPR